MTKEKAIVAYKAFDQNLRCRDFQYEIGQTYDLTGEPVICKRGFHACEHPFDVYNYYPLGSRVARVSVSGEIARKKDGGGDTKICATQLTVDAELTMPEWIKAGVAWIVGAAKGNVGTGYSGHAAATGYSGHAAATGNSGHAAVEGHSSIAAALGIDGTAKAEAGGAISLACYRWNDKADRYDLIAVRSSLVGENGVEAGKTYRLTEKGDFEEV